MPTDNNQTEIKIGEVDISDKDDPDRSLADRVRNLRNKVQRKEKSIRAKRRAKAREEELADPGAAEEAKNLAGDAKDLADTALGGTGDSDFLSKVGDSLDGLDAEGIDEPLFEGGGDGMADPVKVTEESEASLGVDAGGGGGRGGGDADDVLLDPGDADPLSMDGDDEMDDLF